jgi:DNA-binding transcriptional LysR family regulator
MELTQLRYFVEVARQQNFTKASRVLYIAQPALSRAIASLEYELGVKLFDRFAGRNVRLNETGIRFRIQAEQILSFCENVKHEITDFGQPYHGTVRLLFRCNSYFLREAMVEFLRIHPEISITLEQLHGGESDINDYDLGILSTVHYHPMENRLLILDEEIMLAAPADHPLVKQGEVSIKDLDGLPMGVLSTAHFRNEAEALFQSMDIHPNTIIICNSLMWLRMMVVQGRCFFLYPGVSYEPFEGSVLLHIRDFPLHNYTYIAWPRGKMSKSTSQTKDFLLQEIYKRFGELLNAPNT